MTEPSVAPGWYEDPRGEAALRWWDGQGWTDDTTAAPNGAVTVPAAGTGSAPGGATASAAATGLTRLAAGGGWQVVVGPSLPSLPALGGLAARRGTGRLLHNPAILLAITTLLGVVPALLTDTAGADALAPVRLGAGLLGAAGAALAPRLQGRARLATTLLPLVFVALQLAAMASTLSSYGADESGLGAALPHLVSGAVTVFAAVRTVLALRRTR